MCSGRCRAVGRVRLGASTGAIAHLLPQAVARLRDAHPDIDVQIAVLTSHDTLARIAQGTLDVGLVALPQTAVAGCRSARGDAIP